MSDRHRDKKKKSKRSSRRRDDDDSDDQAPKKSLVDYSTVSSRPSHPSVAAAPVASSTVVGPVNPQMSSQMQAVVRLMTGQTERTIKEKLADSNRPTWDEYKKDNHDKLNLEGMDQREMEKYRNQLDQEREERLGRGKNHAAKKKKRSSDGESDSQDSRPRRRRKHKKSKKKKRKRSRKHSDGDDSDDSSTDSSEESRRRRKHKKHKKRSKKSKEGDDDDNDSQGSHYRLSSFFQNSDNDE